MDIIDFKQAMLARAVTREEEKQTEVAAAILV